MADTSIYRQQAPQNNPLQNLGNLLQMQGMQNQNLLFQQEFADKAALNKAYTESLDPNTGMIDYNKLGTSFSGAGIGRLLPQAIEGMQGQQKRQLEIDKNTLDLNTSRLNTMNGALSTLLNKPDLSIKDVISKAGEMISQGVMTPQMAANYIAGLPDDPAQIKASLQQAMVQSLASQERLKALMPAPQVVNLGGSQRVVDMNPMTNPGIANQQFQNTMDPGTASTPTNYLAPGPNGTMLPAIGTRQQFANAANAGNVIQTAPALSAQGLTPAEASEMVEVVGPGGAKFKVPKGQLLAQGAPGMGGPGVQTGIGPAAEAALNVAGTGAATDAQTLQRNAEQVPERKAFLGQMENALNDFESGPGAEQWKTVVAGVNRVFGADSKGVASQEEFNKLATQLAQSQFKSLGGTGTDQQLGSAISANPNQAISSLGNKKIIQLLKGNEDAIAAKNQSWQQELQNGATPDGYNKFSAEFNKSFDPRAFQFPYMSPADRKAMVERLSVDERAKFVQNLGNAVKKGWITVPEAAQ